MKKFYITLIAVALVIAFLAGTHSRGPVISQLTNKIKQLANDWAMSQATVASQSDLNARLAQDNQTLDKKYRKEANARAVLQVQLNELKGKGPGVVYVDKPGMHLYEDGLVNLSYNSNDNEFDYRIKDRPLVLTVIHQGKDWTAQVYDPMQEKNLKVSKLEVVQIEAKEKWYKKTRLGLGVGYVDGPEASLVIGYGKTMLQPTIASCNGQIKYGGSLIRLFW